MAPVALVHLLMRFLPLSLSLHSVRFGDLLCQPLTQGQKGYTNDWVVWLKK